MATKQRPAPPLRPVITALVPADQAPGRDVTLGEFIVEQIRAGVDPINAAGLVGVIPTEFQAWMREGTLTTSRLNAGADWTKDFTPEQQDCAVFADQVVRAHSAHIVRLSIISEQAARGTLPDKVTRTERSIPSPTGAQIIETTTRTEKVLPDLDMVKWKLEKLEPQVYGSKATLNVNVVDLTDTDAMTDLVEQKMREVAAALSAPDPIEAAAVEVHSPDRDVIEPGSPASS